MDYNNYFGRMLLVGQDGEVYVKGQVFRRIKQWVVYEEKVLKDFKYILGQKCKRFVKYGKNDLMRICICLNVKLL